MKKLSSLFVIFNMLLTSFILPIKAQDDLSQYQAIVDKVNAQYHSNINIIGLNEYNANNLDASGISYEQAVDKLKATSLTDFEAQCIKLAQYEIKDEVCYDNTPITRAYSGRMKKYFNNNINCMELIYQYTLAGTSTRYFYTGYKPVAKCTQIEFGDVIYFKMTSYSGNFSTDLRSYTLNAIGKLYRNGDIYSSNKSFTIIFSMADINH